MKNEIRVPAAMEKNSIAPWLSLFRFSAPAGSTQGVQRTMVFHSAITLGTKWPQEPPKSPQRDPKAWTSGREHRLSLSVRRVLVPFVWGNVSRASMAGSRDSNHNSDPMTSAYPVTHFARGDALPCWDTVSLAR